MEMSNTLASKNPSVKRLMREAMEMKNSPSADFSAGPVDDNLYEWHFTIRGPPGTEFDNGIYHGIITFPHEYPLKPPDIIIITPNGRFQVNRKICLTISGYHPETWLPSWSVRTVLTALISFMPSDGAGTIASLSYSKEERQKLAIKSRSAACAKCGKLMDLLEKDTTPESQNPVGENAGVSSSPDEKVEGDDSKNQNEESKIKDQNEGSSAQAEFPAPSTIQDAQDRIFNREVQRRAMLEGRTPTRSSGLTLGSFPADAMLVAFIVLAIALLLLRRVIIML